MKTIALTFDDGVQSHYDFAFPLLKQHNLKGTFFITGNRGLSRSNPYMNHKNMAEDTLDFNTLKEFIDEGFEIGNHTFTHSDLRKCSDGQIVKEIEDMNDLLLSYKIKKPKTFCYPGYHTDDRVASVIKSLGFTHARTGYIYTDMPWTAWESDEKPNAERPPISYYPNDSESSLLIKSTGVVNHAYGFEDFVKDVENMTDGLYAVFVFHGLIEDRLASDFKKIVEFISKNDNLNTVNFGELPTNVE